MLVNIIGDAGIDKLIVLLRQSNPELQRATAILLASLAGSGKHQFTLFYYYIFSLSYASSIRIYMNFELTLIFNFSFLFSRFFSDGCSRIVGQGGVAFLKNLMDLVRRGEVNVQNEIDPSTVEYGDVSPLFLLFSLFVYERKLSNNHL